MFTYAKTNIQLYNQLKCLNYKSEDIFRVRNAYHLAIELFSGMYRPSGCSFLSHSIGTASILASLNLPAKMVIAGLLHAAYEHGDFGLTGSTKLSDNKRKYLKFQTCVEVEEYVAKYTQLKWNSQTIPSIVNEFEFMSSDGRNVLLIRIANELEDNLDLAALYCPDVQNRKHYIQKYGPEMTSLAIKLGYPELAAELEKVFSETLSASIIPELVSTNKSLRAFRISPGSYRKRLYIALNNNLYKGIARLKK